MTATVQTRLTSAETRRLVGALVVALAGRGPDPTGDARAILLRVGMVALSLVQEAFIQKAAGGTGSDGIQWPPLKRATVAQRPVSRGEAKQLGTGGERQRGLLTPAQNKRWKAIYGSRKADLVARHGLSQEDASARAAMIAWAVLKSEGAQTKLAVLGGRQVEIGRDTGRLFNSLSPGVPSEDRVLRADPGAVVVGTNVEYAPHFHKLRPLWPPDGRLPAEWRRQLAAEAKRGIVQALTQTAKGA